MGAIDLARVAWTAGWIDGWTPDPLLTVSEWADLHRMLPQKAASEPGPWRTKRTPYLREIMDCCSDHHPAQQIVFMASIQVGKTEVGLNWVGYTIDSTPGPMLAVLPTVEVGERWSKQRLSSMIADSARLRAKIAPARSRDSGNTATVKEFEGGILIIGGSNSAASLSSMPIKKLLLDEVDRFPQELEEEGDPVDIAEGRTNNFQRRKIVKVSSPTIESLSRINKDWKRSDQRRYYVPCPDCGEKQVLKWDNLQWPEGKPEEARYACEHCGVLIEEHKKTSMLGAGEWRATFPERTDIVGFHINALYSPLGLGRTWTQHAKRYLEVKNDPVRLKVFVNQVLGECYEDPDERLDWEELKARVEPGALREIASGCLVLTAGVDVQKDRLEVQVCGWGRGEQMWAGIDWHVIPGDPLRTEVWEALEKYLDQPFINTRGVSMRITSMAVDAGYLPDEVLNFTRTKRNRGVFATKGASARGRQIIARPSKVDFNRRGTVIKQGAELWMVGVDSAKHRFFARLASDRKRGMASERLIHFGEGLPDDYFMQLTAEIYDPNKRAFIKLHGRRNEALDTALLAMVAAMHPRLRVHVAKDHDWERIAATVEPLTNDLFTAPVNVANDVSHETKAAEADAPDVASELPAATDAAAPTTPAEPPAKPVRMPRRNWVTGFKN
jgi:phage terminase large subunit GpA-like protein